MDELPFQSMNKLRAALRSRHPDILANTGDDLDWDWADEGMEFLEAQDYGMAELRFEELICSQPEHSDGYEGLALAYRAQERKEEAVALIAEAVRLARILVSKGYMDQEALDDILREQAEILGM